MNWNWWKLLEPPLPKHFSKERRKQVMADFKRMNWRSWRYRSMAISTFLLIAALILMSDWQGLVGTATIVMLLAGIVLLPLSAASVLRKNMRTVWLAHHVCPECGYDMRASPERCPECGYTPPSSPPT